MFFITVYIYHFSAFQHNETLSQLYALLAKVRPCAQIMAICHLYCDSSEKLFYKIVLFIQPLVYQFTAVFGVDTNWKLYILVL